MWIDEIVCEKAHDELTTLVWVPRHPIVVLGNSCKAASDVYEENCLKDAVAVLKRKGGGGTVVLHPGSVVVSIAAWVKSAFHNREYFDLINQALLDILKAGWSWPGPFSLSGFSDITYDNRKVAGTSLYRRRSFLLYQASVVVDASYHLMDRYLAHPQVEPGYRKQRSHRDFVIGLNSLNEQLTADLLATRLRDDLPSRLRFILAHDLVTPTMVERSVLTQKNLRKSYRRLERS